MMKVAFLAILLAGSPTPSSSGDDAAKAAIEIYKQANQGNSAPARAWLNQHKAERPIKYQDCKGDVCVHLEITLLHAAAMAGDQMFAGELVATHPMDVNAKGAVSSRIIISGKEAWITTEFTPLMIVAMKGEKDFASFLLSKKANPCIRTQNIEGGQVIELSLADMIGKKGRDGQPVLSPAIEALLRPAVEQCKRGDGKK